MVPDQVFSGERTFAQGGLRASEPSREAASSRHLASRRHGVPGPASIAHPDPRLPRVLVPGLGIGTSHHCASQLRGLLGNGFSIPEKARRIILVAYKITSHRLQGLIGPSLESGAEVV